MNFHFDTLSFAFGFIAATLLWWLIFYSLDYFDLKIKAYKENIKENENHLLAVTEEEYLQALHQQIQSMHLAGSIFLFDDIVEIPQLLAPPIVFEPNGTHFHTDIVEQALPYLLDYPELGARFNAPCLSLFDAISGETNIVIVGQPGTGKTTALAYIASELAQIKTVENVLRNRIPVLIHFTDIRHTGSDQDKAEDFLTPFCESINKTLDSSFSSHINTYLKYIFSNGNALLLIDGIDELTPKEILGASKYLESFLHFFPKTKVVLTGSSDHLDGIVQLGFVPLAIMPWTNSQQSHFIKNWGKLWQKNVEPILIQNQGYEQVDITLINRWVKSDNENLSPFEYTLKLWGAYAGDIHSSNPADLILSHIHRLNPDSLLIEPLCSLAAKVIKSQTFVFTEKQLIDLNWSFDSSDNPINLIANKTGFDRSGDSKKKNEQIVKLPKLLGDQFYKKSSVSISGLLKSGLLVSHRENKLQFCHPIFLGYFASRNLVQDTELRLFFNKSPFWVGQSVTLPYLASVNEGSEVFDEFTKLDDPILMRSPLFLARFLKYSRRNNSANWQDKVMAYMVKMIHNEDTPFSLRVEAAVALALSGDVNVPSLFRKLILAPSNSLRHIAAIGIGMMKDPNSVQLLIECIQSASEPVRKAACLALVEIASPHALETLAVYLLQGDEKLRIYASEALANNLTEGHEALREGLSSEDVLVRRAIIFGLSRINEPWTTELLEKIQITDEQWSVRNLAIDILRTRRNPNIRIPKNLTPPNETPWIIEFAKKLGKFMEIGQSQTDLLLLALQDSNKDLFQPALRYLQVNPNEKVLTTITQYLRHSNSQIKDAAFHALKFSAMGGTILQDLP